MLPDNNLPLYNQPVKPAAEIKQNPVRLSDLDIVYTYGEIPFLLEQGNDARCNSAGEALATYARSAGENQPGEEVSSIVISLLASLMHLCDRYGVTDSDNPFSGLVTMAEIHYESEVNMETDL